MAALDDADAGKIVRRGDLTLGRADRITDGTVYVDLGDSVPENIMAVFDWEGLDRDTYPLPADAVDRVTDDAIYVHESPSDHGGTK